MCAPLIPAPTWSPRLDTWMSSNDRQGLAGQTVREVIAPKFNRFFAISNEDHPIFLEDASYVGALLADILCVLLGLP